jgi:probable rRNA maturation factor
MAADAAAAPRRAPVRVAVSNGVRSSVPGTRAISQWVQLGAAGRVRRTMDLSLRVVGAGEGRALNRRYRGRDYPTNVLSFAAPRAARLRDRQLGDLVICAPIVAREARQQGKSLRAHWAHLVIHGTLHLLGYDHQRVRDAERMERREVRLMRALGYKNPYGETHVDR